MPTQTHTVQISFPELRMHPSAGHKLRGYFGNLFRGHSALLHNHFADGSHIYRYPLVQYKVVDRTPMLLGVGEGAPLLVELFLQIKELELEGKAIPLHQKNIRSAKATVGVAEGELFRYRFKTLWMALNQRNYAAHQRAEERERQRMLDRILVPNMLSFLKGIGYREEGRILAKASTEGQATQFKDQKMLAFRGTFTTNMQLPDFIGLGKSVARGYGAIVREG